LRKDIQYMFLVRIFCGHLVSVADIGLAPETNI
jgi:hypothetical protein